METGLKRTDYFVGQVFRKYLFSSILAMLSTGAATIIDTIIVGNFLGETGLSAMSIVNPVQLIYFTIGAVFGMGGSIAGAIAIGNNDYGHYRRIFSLTTYVLLILGIITTVLGLIFIEPLSVMFGARGVTLQYAKDYLKAYIMLGSFTLLVYPPLYFLKDEGKPNVSSFLFFLSCLLNVVFSWLFMSPVCDMGIKGASLATGISMGVTAILGFIIMLKGSKDLRFVKCDIRDIKKIVSLGSPNGLNNLFSALKIFSLNAVIMYIGASACLASFALVKSVSDLLTNVIMGISSALMPIIGVFYGEKDNDSIRRVLKKAFINGAVPVIILALITGCFPKLWCFIFNISNPETADGAGAGLICLAVSVIFSFFNLILLGYFNTIKKPRISNIILFLRLIAYLVPFAFVFGKPFGIGGVFSSLIIADVLTLLSVFFIIAYYRKREPSYDKYLLNVENEGTGEICFSVKNSIDDIINASTKISEFCENTEIDAKRSMKISLALEEMLTIIITYCMDNDKEQFIDIRIVKMGDNVLLRIRNAGKIFDPVSFYEENKTNEEMADKVLGIKMIANSAKNISFHKTFGTNNLMIEF